MRGQRDEGSGLTFQHLAKGPQVLYSRTYCLDGDEPTGRLGDGTAITVGVAGALYHVMSRGNRRESIYLNDGDFTAFLTLMAEVCKRFNWLIHAYCLMTNHYHLLVETPDANLSRGMRHLNGVYTQRFNRRHRRVGHVFQGRYKAQLVQKDAYLLDLARYIVLNPVRARMVRSAGEWRWSNYHYVVGRAAPPAWLEQDWLLAQFGTQRSESVAAYRRFVAEGLAAGDPFDNMEAQLFLGDASFARRLRSMQKTSHCQRSPRHTGGPWRSRWKNIRSNRKAVMKRWPAPISLCI